MTRTSKKTLITVLALIIIVFVAVLAYALTPSATRNMGGGTSAAGLNQPELIQAGAYVAAASDCIACHTAPGGKPFAGGRPNGKAQDVVTGFLGKDGKTRGRPVGLAVDRAGGLLIADDVGNVVWRVTAAN